MNHYAILKWYQLSGITEVIGNLAIDRFFEFQKTLEEKTPVTLAQPTIPAQKQNVIDPNISFVAQAKVLLQFCIAFV